MKCYGVSGGAIYYAEQYDESQHPRDENGRWTSGGGGGHSVRAGAGGKKRERGGGETSYSKGDKVVSRVSAQGMKKGRTYTITGVDATETPFGTFVAYQLDHKLWIQNGHLLLEPA